MGYLKISLMIIIDCKCSAIDGLSISNCTPAAQGTSWTRARKKCKSWRMGKSGEMLSSAHDVAIAHMKPCCMNHCSLPLQDLHKTKPVKSSSIERGGVPELFKVNGCWGKQSQFSSKLVGSSCPSGWPHSHVCICRINWTQLHSHVCICRINWTQWIKINNYRRTRSWKGDLMESWGEFKGKVRHDCVQDTAYTCEIYFKRINKI